MAICVPLRASAPPREKKVSSSHFPLNIRDAGRLTNRVDAVETTKYTYAHGLLATEDGPWADNTVA